MARSKAGLPQGQGGGGGVGYGGMGGCILKGRRKNGEEDEVNQGKGSR